MPRLYRPHVPLETRCRVALRQLGELWPDEAIAANADGLGAFLDRLLKKLAELLGEEKLHLDHDPPLAARPQFRRGLGRKVYYEPDANDPDHLIYRGKHAHHIKTNVRGEHGQHPDRVLIKREKRRHKKAHKKRQKWRSQPLRSANRWPPKGSRKIEQRRST